MRKDLTAAERRAKAAQLYKDGWSYREIAAELGISKTTVGRYIEKNLKELAEVSISETRLHRQLILERLQHARKMTLDWINKYMHAEKHKDNDVWKIYQGIDRLLQINEQEIRLYGLNEGFDLALILPPDAIEAMQQLGLAPSDVQKEFVGMLREAAKAKQKTDDE